MTHPIRLAINGFGRIGRLTLRALLEKSDSPLTLVAINDLGAPEQMAHALKYDSVHGRGTFEASVSDGKLRVGPHEATLLSERDPAALPWAEMNIDLVLDCTGRFTDREGAAKHLSAGAKKC